MGSSATTSTGSTRRNLVKGAAWSVPLMAVGAPAAHAGISQCEVTGSIQVGPKEFVDVRAICEEDSQELEPETIMANYGRGYLPRYLEICNCTNSDKWYRWQELDTLSSFQIEVDGVHNDQNGPGQGWRPSFQLPAYSDTGGCKKFNLTYRTSRNRPYSSLVNSLPPSNDRDAVNISFVLESGPSSTGPWTHETSLTITGGATWRIVQNRIDFDCHGWWGRSSAASATEGAAGETKSAPSGGSGD